MKKSKIFIAVGTVVLAISAMFATKANKKFAGITTAYFVSGSDYFIKGASSVLTTTPSVSGLQLEMKIYTNTSSLAPKIGGSLFTATSGGGNAPDVYYN